MLRAALVLTAFLSGAAALVLETLWFRQAGLALGSSVWATSLVLASFMAGLAIGNALAARAGSRVQRPLVAYAGLELLVAVTGVSLVFAWPALGGLLAPVFRTIVDAPVALTAVRLAVAFLLMLVPAVAMGATLPLLARALAPLEASFGRVLGWLYGWNTLGAVAGTVAAEMLLVGWLGIRGTALAAGLLNVAAASIAFRLSDRFAVLESEQPVAAGPAGGGAVWRPLSAAFLCGAALLALEVVWFRFLSMFLAGTSLAFCLMLAVVLLGIGLGGLLAAAWLRRDPEAGAFLRPVVLACGAVVVVSYAAFQEADGLQRLGFGPARVLGLGLRLMLPVSLLSGVAFTLLGQASHAGAGSEARTVGRLAMANTLGALAGSLAAGFLLLPVLGMERSFAVLALAYGLAAALVPRPAGARRGARLAQPAALALYALVLALFPFGLMRQRYFAAIGERHGRDGSRIVAVREGTNETVLYMRRDLATEPSVFRLVTNGYAMSGTALASRRYMSLYAFWPAAVHPDLRRALLISYGVGVTARALTRLPSLEHIDVVDISRDVLEMSRIAQPPAADPLADPRVRVHVEDGRQFLQTSRGGYDLITGEPPPPHAIGVVNLYSREYFHIVREGLAPGGIITYWLPVNQLPVRDARAIVGAFCGAFADCSLWSGSGLDWMLVGSKDRIAPVSEERFLRPWEDPGLAGAMAEVGLETPEQLGALFIGDADFLRGLVGAEPPLVDDFPQRITSGAAEGPSSQPAAYYRSVMDAETARGRFEASGLIAGIWPKALRERTLDYFEWQRYINRGFMTLSSWRPPEMTGLGELDGILTRTPLRTLALWSLGTSVGEQAVVAALASRKVRHEELIGLGALAERDYSRAAEDFARAPGFANAYRRAYALARAGRLIEAASLADEIRARPDRPADDDFWRWMDGRFGVRGHPLVDRNPGARGQGAR